jgi:predicted RNA-binding protein with PIN domain
MTTPSRNRAASSPEPEHTRTGAAHDVQGSRRDDGLTWLIDGYNLLHACLLTGTDRRDWWKAENRETVLALAGQLGDPGAEIWVVFDGTEESQEIYAPPQELDSEGEGHSDDSTAGTPPEAAPPVHVVFTSSADDWIVKRVRRAEEPSLMAVVTSDRQVAGRAAHRGARVVWPRDFLELCRTHS